MQTNQTEPPTPPRTMTREEVEDAIAEQQDRIFEERYQLRWVIRSYHGIGWGSAIAFVAFTVGWALPMISPVTSWIGGVAACVVVGSAFGLLYASIEKRQFVNTHRERLRVRKRALQKLRWGLAYFDEQALKHLTPEQYMHQLPKLITSYRKQADRYRNRFIVIQITTILLSASITSLSGGWLDRYFVVPWVIPVMSAIISILTSFTLFFKFREKGTNLQQTANAMDWEHMACTLGIGQYEGLDRADALTLLAKTGEALRKEQQQRQIQLEQSSHAEQKALQSNT